jgi:acetate kinase
MQYEHMDAAAIEDLIYRRSGLLGVSGISSDMRTLLASEAPEARQAIDLFVYRIGRELGSLVAALGGVDAIVFTGGIGENGVQIRTAVVGGLDDLGIVLDPAANATAKGEAKISTADSRTQIWVMPTNEELIVARQTKQHLQGEG